MKDADDATLVELYVTFPTGESHQPELVLAAFRDLHLIGGPLPGEDDTRGALTAVIAAHPDRGLLVWASDGDVASTPAGEVIATLAARLRAAIHLDLGEDSAVSVDHMITGERDPAMGSDPHEEVPSSESAHRSIAVPSRELTVVAGNLSLSPDRRAELALQIEGGVTVLGMRRRRLWKAAIEPRELRRSFAVSRMQPHSRTRCTSHPQDSAGY